MSLFAELKRRNVIRIGIAYVLMGWVALQFADFALDLVDAPNWVIQSLTIILALGLPFALFFAWAYELTPEGLKRDADVDRTQSTTLQTARKLDRTIIVVLIVAAGYFFWESRFAGDGAAPSSTAETEAPASAAATDRSVAVLPFVNMSSDPEQEYFSDGITEEIINAVVKIPGISVPARTSVFGFKGHQGDIRDVGMALGVAYLLEGSVRSQGDQVRVTAQLIKVDDGFHLWSDTFDRKLENIFAVQDEIASAIAEVVVGELGVQAVPNRTRNMEAYDLYLQGRAALRHRDETAIDLLTRATEADPAFAPAFAALAIAYNSTGINNVRAAEMAERALALDPQNVDALNAKGAALRSDRQWLEAEQYFDRALAIDPNSAELLEDYAEFLAYVGRIDEALVVTSRGVQIDQALIPLAVAHVEALLSSGQAEEAYAYLTTLINGRQDLDLLWSAGIPVWLDPDIQARPDLALPAAPVFEGAPEWVIELTKAAGRVVAGESTEQDREFLKSQYTTENIVTQGLDGPLMVLRTPLTVLGETASVLATDIGLFDTTRMATHEWNWSPAMRPLRQHPDFYRYLEHAGLIDYWDATAWPKFCQRDDAGVVTCQ